MRAIVLLVVLPVAVLACGEADRPEALAATEAAAAPPRLDFPGKNPIPVRLDMRATADGGRAFGLPPGWRGEVAFAGGNTTRCGVRSGDAGPIDPGASYRVQLMCGDAVRLPDAATRDFRVLEDGREIASGEVLD